MRAGHLTPRFRRKPVWQIVVMLGKRRGSCRLHVSQPEWLSE